LTLPQPPLLLVTDRRRARRPLEEIAAAAFAAGCRWLSLREKDLPAAERQDLLQRLVVLGARWNACVGVHEDIVAATGAGAGAIHLPDGAALNGVRARLGADALLGISAHDVAGIERAAAAGVDYVTLSPIFATSSKPGYGPALGLDRLAQIAAHVAVPIVALGGIDAASAPDCMAAGAAGVAVMGAVMAAADPARHVAALVAALAGRGVGSHSDKG
jgi:thiamine-phosphate pyrophosphorylase